MQEIVLNGKPTRVSDFLDGFEIKATPASTYTAIVAVNKDKGELLIQFRPGKKELAAGLPGPQFFYSPVDPLVLHQLMSAHSTGEFFSREIKPFHKGPERINELLFSEIAKELPTDTKS